MEWVGKDIEFSGNLKEIIKNGGISKDKSFVVKNKELLMDTAKKIFENESDTIEEMIEVSYVFNR
jgi:hypothetical protein